jgi:acylphosphatase
MASAGQDTQGPDGQERVRAQVVVYGRVQGVGFRYSTARRARSLGVAGWVRNRGDGAVEAVFEGSRERVESMLHWCRRGPDWARPEQVELEWQEPAGDEIFRIR